MDTVFFLIVIFLIVCFLSFCLNSKKSEIEELEVKFKPLDSNFVLPYKAHETDACFDLVVTKVEKVGSEITYHFGFSTEIPKGYKGVIVPRSNFTKQDFIMKNSPGQIDSEYRGEWLMKISYLGSNLSFELPYKEGERAAQAYFEKVLPIKLTISNSLTGSDRGVDGFGSTGK